MASGHADITVVVTNHDYASYLEEAVLSALRQEGGAPHVVVVDDGSTEPGTEAVLARLPPEVVVHRQDNAGRSAARNAGLAAASTTYLIALDADDRLSPTALNALRRPLEDELQLGFTYGVARFFGAWTGTLGMPPYDPFKLLYRHMIGVTALMRREVFADVGGFDSAVGYEDWDFWLGALGCGWRGRRVEEVTLEVRRHGDSMLSSDRRQYRRWYRALRRKHAHLYARSAELARESGAGPLERAVYRWWWGARPVPARAEQALHALRWRVRG